MAGELTPQDPLPDDGAVRASDEERDRVVRLVSEHAGAGRLTLSELEERVAQAYSAVTRADLALVTADLPVLAPPATPAGAGGTAADRDQRPRRAPARWVVSLMGGNDKRGRWRVGERVNVVAVMGGNDVDLRHAELDVEDVTITAVAIMGGIDLYVPDTVDVEVGGFALMGGNDERGSTRPPRPGAPRIRVRAYSLMGGVDVWRLPEAAADMSLSQARKLARRSS